MLIRLIGFLVYFIGYSLFVFLLLYLFLLSDIVSLDYHH